MTHIKKVWNVGTKGFKSTVIQIQNNLMNILHIKQLQVIENTGYKNNTLEKMNILKGKIRSDIHQSAKNKGTVSP